MNLTQGIEESSANMASTYKEQILNLLDKVDIDDLMFIRQIYTLINKHVARKTKGEHPE